MHLFHLLLSAVTVSNNGAISSNGGGFVQPGGNSLGHAIQTGINAFAFIIGAVSIIMVLVGAFRYVVSAGNPSAITAAKDTILYAVIGVIISIVALAIVNFVIGKF